MVGAVKPCDSFVVGFEHLTNNGGRAIPDPQPQDFRWRALHHAEVHHIGIFGDECEPFCFCIAPNRRVICSVKTHVDDMGRTREEALDRGYQLTRQILVEEELQSRATKG